MAKATLHATTTVCKIMALIRNDVFGNFVQKNLKEECSTVHRELFGEQNRINKNPCVNPHMTDHSMTVDFWEVASSITKVKRSHSEPMPENSNCFPELWTKSVNHGTGFVDMIAHDTICRQRFLNFRIINHCHSPHETVGRTRRQSKTPNLSVKTPNLRDLLRRKTQIFFQSCGQNLSFEASVSLT